MPAQCEKLDHGNISAKPTFVAKEDFSRPMSGDEAPLFSDYFS